MDNPATTNQPRDPLASLPIPGINTRISITIVSAKAGKAKRRMRFTGMRSAT